MSTNGIRVEEFNIFALGAEAVSYHLKNIHTVALQVTETNIGVLSLELEVELCYYNDGTPFIEAYFARGTKDQPEVDRYANIKIGSWFVILWDEIHVFRDKEFRSTFSFDGPSTPRMTDEDVEKVAGELNKAVGPNLQKVLDRRAQGQTEIMSPVGELDTDESNGSVQ